MLVGFVCLVAGLVVSAGAPALLAAPFALLGWAVLGTMIAIAGTLAALPFASVELPSAAAVATATLMAVLIGGIAWRDRRSRMVADEAAARSPATPPARGSHRGRRRLAFSVVVGLATVVVGTGMVLGIAQGGGRLVVTVLDIGQGDAILVEGPRGGRLLLDSGPDPDRLLAVLDRHVPPWDRRIDLVVLTHPHEDHAAGLALLLARYRVAGIAENGMLGAGPGDAAFRTVLATTGVTTRRLAAGDRLALDGVRATVRWPLRGEVPHRSPDDGRRVNDTSIVLDMWYGERRVLLTGDIEDDVDPRLLDAGIGYGDRRLDVLKVAHHGSRTATSDAWLEALRPRVALVSAGTGNPYGHPAPRTLERLGEHGARVLRTDLDGDLEVSTDGHDLRIATSGGRSVAWEAGDTRPRATTRSSAAAGPARGAFALGTLLCAIPLSPAGLAALPPAPWPRPARGRPVTEDGPPPGDPHDAAGGDPALACYDRSDDDPHPTRRGRAPALVRSATGDPGALHGHRGRGSLARAGREPRGPPGGPGRGGGLGAAA
jgi:competence protein ComEC